MMPATAAPIRPSQWPAVSSLDRASQSWRHQPLTRGLVGGLLPAWGWRDYVNNHSITGVLSPGDLPDRINHPALGPAWDLSGSRKITLGNWGNDTWCGPAAQFSITVVIDRFHATSSGGCIVSKADGHGIAWDLWDISHTTHGIGRLQWFIRGSSGAYMGMYTSAPPAEIIRTHQANVITATCDMSRTGSSRIQTWINGYNTSTGYETAGDISNGVANLQSAIILGYFQPDNGYYWPGKLGGVWFHNRALGPAEIQQLHTPHSHVKLLPWRRTRRLSKPALEPEPSPESHPYYFRKFILRRSA